LNRNGLTLVQAFGEVARDDHPDRAAGGVEVRAQLIVTVHIVEQIEIAVPVRIGRLKITAQFVSQR